jgi:hypothetical protein
MCGTRTYVTQVGDLLDLVRCRTVGRQRLYRINGAALVTVPSDLEIRIERAFDAPADLVFKAWTTPNPSAAGGATSRLLSCRATSTCTRRRVALRTRSSDGTELGWRGTYIEIDATCVRDVRRARISDAGSGVESGTALQPPRGGIRHDKGHGLHPEAPSFRCIICRQPWRRTTY